MENTRNKIDYLCIHERRKTYVVNAKTLPGADCGSYHELLTMSMMLKIRKTKSAERTIPYDMIHIPVWTSKLRFEEHIPIVDEMTLNELCLWEKIKIITATVAKVKLSRKRFRKNSGYQKRNLI